jgi:hypothetical protein
VEYASCSSISESSRNASYLKVTLISSPGPLVPYHPRYHRSDAVRVRLCEPRPRHTYNSSIPPQPSVLSHEAVSEGRRICAGLRGLNFPVINCEYSSTCGSDYNCTYGDCAISFTLVRSRRVLPTDEGQGRQRGQAAQGARTSLSRSQSRKQDWSRKSAVYNVE